MTNLARTTNQNGIAPFGAFTRMPSLFDDFMRDFFEPADRYWGPQSLLGQIERARCKRVDDKLVLELDVPGVKKDDIKVFLQEGRLNVSWKKRDQSYSHTEYVGDVVDPVARVEDGVLTVTLRVPQAERVEIKVE